MESPATEHAARHAQESTMSAGMTRSQSRVDSSGRIDFLRQRSCAPPRCGVRQLAWGP